MPLNYLCSYCTFLASVAVTSDILGSSLFQLRLDVAIIGGVVGGVVMALIIAAITVVVCILLFKSRRKKLSVGRMTE